MRKTTEYKAENRLTVDIEGLMAMLSCGEVTAKKIADYAEARVIIGRRVLYNEDTLRHTGCTRLGENNVNPKVMQYVMGCWMSGGHPFSTDRSGAKNIRMHRSQ